MRHPGSVFGIGAFEMIDSGNCDHEFQNGDLVKDNWILLFYICPLYATMCIVIKIYHKEVGDGEKSASGHSQEMWSCPGGGMICS